jgi:hypothetical protein
MTNQRQSGSSCNLIRSPDLVDGLRKTMGKPVSMVCVLRFEEKIIPITSEKCYRLNKYSLWNDANDLRDFFKQRDNSANKTRGTLHSFSVPWQ